MRFAFIERNREVFPVDLMCQILKVSRSGYYAWSQRTPRGSAASNSPNTSERLTRRAVRPTDRHGFVASCLRKDRLVVRTPWRN